jgi:GAF domain-containing protein
MNISSKQMDAALQQRERLEEIADLGLLSDASDPVLETLCARAADELGLPIGLVTVVLDQAQHFAASHGLSGWLASANGTPVEWSFCRYSVASGESLVVPDATTHVVGQDNPLVAIDGVRCYAGMPLISSRGFTIGSLCVVGVEERQFADAELATLRSLADQVVAHIETRRSTIGSEVAA